MAKRARKQQINAGAQQRAKFLQALRMVGHVGKAAEEAGPHPSTFYKLREKDPEFRREWAAAIDTFYRGPMESHVIDLAFNGYVEVTSKRQVLPNGQMVEVERKVVNRKFPTLALRLLERRHPDYMPKEERTVFDGDEPEADLVDQSKLTRKERQQLARLLMKAAPD